MRRTRFSAFIDRYVGVALSLILAPLTVLARRSASKEEVPPSRILLIKLSALGDTVLLIPAIRALRAAFPEARITMVCTPINREVVEECAYLDDTVVLEVDRLLKRPWSFLRFVISLRRKGFDLCIDADQWLRVTALISFFSGARRRVGFRTPGQLKHLLFTDSIRHRRDRHELECFLDLVGKTVISDPRHLREHLEFPISADNVEQAGRRLTEIGMRPHFVVVHPGVPYHGWQRQWPPERFADLCKRLVEKFPGTGILLTGTEEDREMVEGIVRSVNGGSAACLTGLTIKELAAILSLSRLVVCNNTGILHLACALGRPVVALHGPTDPVRWGPRSEGSISVAADLECSPCLYLGSEYACKTNTCMRSIGVDEVFSAVKTLLTQPSLRT